MFHCVLLEVTKMYVTPMVQETEARKRDSNNIYVNRTYFIRVNWLFWLPILPLQKNRLKMR